MISINKMKKAMLLHLQSYLLPFVVLLVIPWVLLQPTGGLRMGWELGAPFDYIAVAVGCVIIIPGLFLLGFTIRQFIVTGRGTLAPWSPTRKLVVSGPYRYVRNPMISGVVMVLLGESVLTGSLWVFAWCVFFCAMNHVYFIFSEEPGLVKRFGDEYLVYKRSVPRWVPRTTPWKGEGE
jgi:protein-S-isoprenylcysteine O-methyltransferase Ste14